MSGLPKLSIKRVGKGFSREMDVPFSGAVLESKISQLLKEKKQELDLVLNGSTVLTYKLSSIEWNEGEYNLKFEGTGDLADGKKYMDEIKSLAKKPENMLKDFKELADDIKKINTNLGIDSLAKIENILNIEVKFSASAIDYNHNKIFLLKDDSQDRPFIIAPKGFRTNLIDANEITLVRYEPGDISGAISKFIYNRDNIYRVKNSLSSIMKSAMNKSVKESSPVYLNTLWDFLYSVHKGKKIKNINPRHIPIIELMNENDKDLESTLSELYKDMGQNDTKTQKSNAKVLYEKSKVNVTERGSYFESKLRSRCIDSIMSVLPSGKQTEQKYLESAVKSWLERFGIPIDHTKLDYTKNFAGLMDDLKKIIYVMQDDPDTYGFLPYNYVEVNKNMEIDADSNDPKFWTGSAGIILKRENKDYSVRLSNGVVINPDAEEMKATKRNEFPDWYASQPFNMGDEIVMTEGANDTEWHFKKRKVKPGMKGKVIGFCYTLQIAKTISKSGEKGKKSFEEDGFDHFYLTRKNLGADALIDDLSAYIKRETPSYFERKPLFDQMNSKMVGPPVLWNEEKNKKGMRMVSIVVPYNNTLTDKIHTFYLVNAVTNKEVDYDKIQRLLFDTSDFSNERTLNSFTQILLETKSKALEIIEFNGNEINTLQYTP